MVQMALDGIGRGNAIWDKAETFLRDNFGNTGSSGNAIRSYYYGLFSFTKAMLLHDANGDLVAEPITMLSSQTAGVPPVDWWAAEVSQGAPLDGVARTLVNGQDPAGYWSGHNNQTAEQFPFESGWAIVMLRRTITQRPPVAVVRAIPNPGEVGQPITFDCSASFHLDPNRQIVAWDWDLDNDGVFGDASGPTATRSFPALGDYPVTCKVTDGGDDQGQNVQSATATVVADVSIPPLPPTADAGGPYVFCPQQTPWYLDGTGSVNPDDGLSEPGQPPDGIQSWAWDLDESGVAEAFGPQPDVTAAFTARGPGDYLVSLKVTDRTATAFPQSGLPDLSATATTTVHVRAADAPECGACLALTATASSSPFGAHLAWTDAVGYPAYKVYRATVAGGPYALRAMVTATTYDDTDVVSGTTYYYVVWGAQPNGDEICRSNEASATPVEAPRCSLRGRKLVYVSSTAAVGADIGSAPDTGITRLGWRSTMLPGTTVSGGRVFLDNFAVADDVAASTFVRGRGVVVLGDVTTDVPALPDPFCPVPAVTCGGDTVKIARGETMALAPGRYGRIHVLADATLELTGGTYEACAFEAANNATLRATGTAPAVLNVKGRFRMVRLATVASAAGTPPPTINAASIDVGPLSAVEANLAAPNGLVKIGRATIFHGSACAETLRTGWHALLACPVPPIAP